MQRGPPGDASSSYLASLHTTEAVLAALRKAHKARLGIMGGLPPAQHVLGAPLAVNDMASAHGLDSLHCQRMAFSSCAQYLAVTFLGRMHDQDPDSDSDGSAPDCGVLVFHAVEGFRQTAFRCAPQALSLQWAPGSAHLSVALQMADVDSTEQYISSEYPTAETLDAQTGRAVHTLGPENDSMVQRLKATHHQVDSGVRSVSWLQWSPSGRSLLLSTSKGLQGHQCQGAILVFDVWRDRLVQSDYSAPYLGTCITPAVWHPSSAGLVLSAGVELKDAAAFIKAGLALGELPQYCYAHTVEIPMLGMGFSPDGYYFLSRYTRPGVDSDNFWGTMAVGEPYPDKGCCMLKCEFKGSKIAFSPPHWHAICHDCHWVPRGQKVVIGVYSYLEWIGQRHNKCSAGKIVEVSHSCGEDTVTELPAPLGQAPIAFSPSGRLVAETVGSPHILNVESGEQIWAAPLPGVSEHAARWGTCAAFLPSGCGLVCVEAFQGKVDMRFLCTERLHSYIWA